MTPTTRSPLYRSLEPIATVRWALGWLAMVVLVSVGAFAAFGLAWGAVALIVVAVGGLTIEALRAARQDEIAGRSRIVANIAERRAEYRRETARRRRLARAITTGDTAA